MSRMVSVIVPCYNASGTLERCIRSLLDQTYGDFEIITVNDGSSDGTSDVLRRLSEEDDRIIVLDQENAGVSAARNNGMKVAHGEYISFVDADDYVEPVFLERLTDCISDADISVCHYMTEAADEGRSSDTVSVEDLYREMFLPQDNIAAFVWNRLYRSSIIKELALEFDEKIYACEDTLFNFMYMKNVSKAGICMEYLYHYMINPDSAMFGKDFNERKISANKAYGYMLKEAAGKPQKILVEAAAMWFNLILKRQIYKSRYVPEPEELATINRMLRLNARAFMEAPIPLKYKAASPSSRSR